MSPTPIKIISLREYPNSVLYLGELSEDEASGLSDGSADGMERTAVRKGRGPYWKRGFGWRPVMR